MNIFYKIVCIVIGRFNLYPKTRYNLLLSVIFVDPFSQFTGALQGQRARKGIFLTTGSFSKDAIDHTSRIDSKIILIDEKKLAEYMIDHNVGVSAVKYYIIKNITTDYFDSFT